jgi:methylphosphotriester-DNA--protein-cysteine methyltransferase
MTEEGAGFDVMSFAANHALDHGYESNSGFRDAFERTFGKPPGRALDRTPLRLDAAAAVDQ